MNVGKILLDNWHFFVNAGATEKFTLKKVENAPYVPNNPVSENEIASVDIDVVKDAIGGGNQKFQFIQTDDYPILSIDFVLIFPTKLIDFVPKIEDKLIDENQVEYEIKAINQDSMDAHFELWVRPI